MVYPSYSGLPLVSNHQGGILQNVTSTRGSTKSFPLSFKTVFSILVNSLGKTWVNTYKHYPLVTELTTTSFTVSSDDANLPKLHWIAIGK
nr:MAG TPA: putative tail fiber protein [Caudoviricetes sp.]